MSEPTTPLKAIRAKCIECSGDSPYEVKRCSSTDCVLYPFRFGKNPFRKKTALSDEQRAARRENMLAARQQRRTQEFTEED